MDLNNLSEEIRSDPCKLMISIASAYLMDGETVKQLVDAYMRIPECERSFACHIADEVLATAKGNFPFKQDESWHLYLNPINPTEPPEFALKQPDAWFYGEPPAWFLDFLPPWMSANPPQWLKDNPPHWFMV